MTSASPGPRPPRRHAFVGVGHRAEMYFAALCGPHADVGMPVALCDTNPTRMAYYQRLRQSAVPGSDPLPTYAADAFEAMLRQEQPDAVIVASVDSAHAEHICAALRHGCDVISEKPLTIDADGCRRIVAAVEASESELTVAFNYRYSPRNSALKRLLRDGAVGAATSVTFEWMLDTVHGADYFRRWHRDKTRSGGLLVHKATHHFDLVNWWLDDTPEQVFALGNLSFYGRRNAQTRGVSDAEREAFGLDLASDPRLRALYLEARADDGYLRDQDVFSDGISIEDNMGVLVRYAGGPILTYALNAHSPWEGYRVAVNGTAGRLELSVCERAHVRPDSGRDVIGRRRQALDPSARPELQAAPEETPRQPGAELILQRHWEPPQPVAIPRGAGGPHGGGDELLLDDLFRGVADDPLGRRAGYRDGVASVLVGVAANQAIATGKSVAVADLGVPLPPQAPP